MSDLLCFLLLLAINLYCIYVLELIMGGIKRPANVIFMPIPYRDWPHEKGNLELSHGNQEIFVPTSRTPERVWLCFEHFEGVQTCIGQTDMVNTYITPEGFVIIANINSEKVSLKWNAEFE